MSSQEIEKIALGSLVRIKHYADFEPQEELYIITSISPMGLRDYRNIAEHYTFCYGLVPIDNPKELEKYHYHNELIVVSSS